MMPAEGCELEIRTDGNIANRPKAQLVGMERAAENAHALVEPRLYELPEERDTRPPREKDIDPLGLGGADLSDLARIIDGLDVGVELGKQLALERPLGPGDIVTSGLVVEAHRDHRFDALLGHVGAHRLSQRIVVERDSENVRKTVLAGEAGRAGISADDEHAAIVQRLADRVIDVRHQDAGHDMDLAAVDKP